MDEKISTFKLYGGDFSDFYLEIAQQTEYLETAYKKLAKRVQRGLDSYKPGNKSLNPTGDKELEEMIAEVELFGNSIHDLRENTFNFLGGNHYRENRPTTDPTPKDVDETRILQQVENMGEGARFIKEYIYEGLKRVKRPSDKARVITKDQLRDSLAGYKNKRSQRRLENLKLGNYDLDSEETKTLMTWGLEKKLFSKQEYNAAVEGWVKDRMQTALRVISEGRAPWDFDKKGLEMGLQRGYVNKSEVERAKKCARDGTKYVFMQKSEYELEKERQKERAMAIQAGIKDELVMGNDAGGLVIKTPAYVIPPTNGCVLK